MSQTELHKTIFIALETFRKNGEGVVTPVWVTGNDGFLYVWTNHDSWKVKRIRNNNRVRICESDARGNPKGAWQEAQARILDSEDSRDKIKQLFRSKYGFQFRIFSAMGRKSKKTVIEISNF
jgi:PPOX class probable F420-dependent enzyme